LDLPANIHLQQNLSKWEMDIVVRQQAHVAQVVLLECIQTDRLVVVVNTHLIMHTIAANVRSIQAYLIMSKLQCWIDEMNLLEPPAVVLCGENNSVVHYTRLT